MYEVMYIDKKKGKKIKTQKYLHKITKENKLLVNIHKINIKLSKRPHKYWKYSLTIRFDLHSIKIDYSMHV